MSVAGGSMQVEKILDDLIYRLANTDATAEVRAALVEAKRLKSVTMRWGAIPPPPDARREMLARVMELIESVNGPNGPSRSPSLAPPMRPSSPPVSSPLSSPRFSSPPSSPNSASRSSSSTRRDDRDTPLGDAALPRDALPQRNRSAELDRQERRTAPPPPLPSGFRSRSDSGFGGSGPSSQPGGRSDARLEEQRSAPPRLPMSRGPTPSPMRSSSAPVTARSTAPTRRPPPSRRPTEPPPLPTAMLPSTDASSEDETMEISPEPPRSAPRVDPPARPLSLRPPGAPAPPAPRRETPTHPQPFTRTQSALPAADHPRVPIRAIGNSRGDGLDGLSTSISSSKRRAVEEEKQRADAAFRLSDPVFPRLAPMETPTAREVSAQIATGITLVRPDCTDWQPHPVASGATLKLLYHNAQTGDYTALVRLMPGSTFPARKHLALEEMFLVTGSATIGALEMHAGEYTRAEPSSEHPEIRTATGCTFLVSGSEHDEMIVEGGA